MYGIYKYKFRVVSTYMEWGKEDIGVLSPNTLS